MPKLFVLFMVISFFIFFGCATEEEMFIIDDRLSALEQRHEAMDRRLNSVQTDMSSAEQSRSSDEQSLRGQYAAMRVDLNEMREEIQKLNGRIEETLYKLNLRMKALENANRQQQETTTRLNGTAEENAERLVRIENYLNFERASKAVEKPAPVVAPPPPETEKASQEDQLYLSAKQAFDRGEFDMARKGFADLINRFPKSTHSDNAQFWIGETYYRDKWYEKAILEYQKVIEKYPKGNKVQASLLKQGFSFANLGDAANARLILKELIRKYPKSNEAAIARKKLEGLQ